MHRAGVHSYECSFQFCQAPAPSTITGVLLSNSGITPPASSPAAVDGNKATTPVMDSAFDVDDGQGSSNSDDDGTADCVLDVSALRHVCFRVAPCLKLRRYWCSYWDSLFYSLCEPLCESAHCTVGLRVCSVDCIAAAVLCFVDDTIGKSLVAAVKSDPRADKDAAEKVRPLPRLVSQRCSITD
jgi:hypothetical protein